MCLKCPKIAFVHCHFKNHLKLFSKNNIHLNLAKIIQLLSALAHQTSNLIKTKKMSLVKYKNDRIFFIYCEIDHLGVDREKFNLSLLSMGLSFMTFIMLTYVSFLPNLLRYLILKVCSISSNAFFSTY